MTSQLRNVISDLFPKRYGSGIHRILDVCHEAELPEPLFENFSGGFRVKFTLPPPNHPPQFTELEQRILGLLKKYPRVSSSELSERLSIGRDTVKEYLGRLKKKGILIREGSARSGYWVVIE